MSANNISLFDKNTVPEKNDSSASTFLVVGLSLAGLALLIAIAILLCWLIVIIRRKYDEAARRKKEMHDAQLSGWAEVIAEMKLFHRQQQRI
ncbi:hypothetical protein niasHT_022120 [Heterodera trifolii]|uniref:Uncharacterized protein n=1 Tax=Heterodera trifolii TaxID=157864 RepID=A0ABD2K8Z1_9BILA